MTVLEAKGFGESINNEHSWNPILHTIHEASNSFHQQSSQPDRSNLKDNRVHACVYFIRPSHSLSLLDIQTMKAIGQRVNLIPVIAKADTFHTPLLEGYDEQDKEHAMTLMVVLN